MRYLAILIVIISTYGCSSINVNSAPHYDGVVTPIVSPVNLQYSPSFGKSVTSIDIIYGSKHSHTSITSSYRSILEGDKLKWTITIDKFIDGDKVIQYRMPLAQATMLTTRKMDFINVDMDFPAFSAIGKSILKGTKEYNDFISLSTKNFFKFVDSPIASGDVAMYADIEYANIYSRKLKMTLDGISIFRGRNVYILSINENDIEIVTNDNGRDVAFVMDISGYTILDSATLMTVKGAIRLVCTDKSGKRGVITVESNEI